MSATVTHYRVHWLETTTKVGTPIGTLACNALVSSSTVVSVQLSRVTCRRCKRTRAWKLASKARTTS